MKPLEAQATAKKLLLETRTATRLVEFLLEIRHYASWQSRADFESRWNIGVSNIGTERRSVQTGRATNERSFSSGDFHGSHFAIASKTETVPWPVEDSDDGCLVTVWLVLNGQQVLVARYTASSEAYSATNFNLFSVEELHWSDAITAFFESTSRAIVDLKRRQEALRVAERADQYAGKFTFNGREAVAPSQDISNELAELVELQHLNDSAANSQQLVTRSGFGAGFVLYLSAWLALGVPLALVGAPRNDPTWYIWFLLFELFFAWWLLPLALYRSFRRELARLDEAMDRTSIGGWANRAVRYGLPRHAGQRKSDNLWALQFFGTMLALLLVAIGITRLPQREQVPLVVAPILFFSTVVSTLGFASFLVPGADERRAMDLRIAGRLHDRQAQIPRQRAQLSQWLRQPSAVWGRRANALWSVTVVMLVVVGIGAVLTQHPEILWIGALLIAAVVVLWFAAAAWPLLLGLAALVFLLKNC